MQSHPQRLKLDLLQSLKVMLILNLRAMSLQGPILNPRDTLTPMLSLKVTHTLRDMPALNLSLRATLTPKATLVLSLTQSLAPRARVIPRVKVRSMSRVKLTVDLNPREKLTADLNQREKPTLTSMPMPTLMSILKPSQRLILEQKSILE